MHLTLDDIRAAETLIRPYLEASPLIKCPWISQELGCNVSLKLENLLPIGSFKLRGALNKVLSLSKEEKSRGVIAASAGNHAQGVAWSAQRLGVPATIVMPKSAPLVKLQNTRSLGAEVVLEGTSYDEAYAFAQKLSEKSGKIYIHAFDDPLTVAGQGTVGLEILEQAPEVDVILGSIGGGGLMGGVGTAVKALKDSVELIGCQATGSAAMVRSLAQGSIVAIDAVQTFADGIAVKTVRPSMFSILSNTLDSWYDVDDEAIAGALLKLIERAHVLAEPSGAVPLAVLTQIRERLQGKNVVLIISGGNIDVNLVSRIIERGLTQSGRRLRFNALISDRPGSLARLTDLIARAEASVIQVIHDRDESYIRMDETEVALTLETRGKEHSEEVLALLRSKGISVEVLHDYHVGGKR